MRTTTVSDRASAKFDRSDFLPSESRLNRRDSNALLLHSLSFGGYSDRRKGHEHVFLRI